VTDCCGGHPELCELQNAIRVATCGGASTVKNRRK
jgi:hypothetical protein